MYLIAAGILQILFYGLVVGQNYERVPPGVPPQHYQQPPSYQQNIPNIQQNQQQMHQQIPQQQFQQPPHVQQVPQGQVPNIQQHQVPNQHPPQQQQNFGHNHGHGHQPQQILNAANVVQEKEHIAEHMDVPMDTSKMTEQELQFHYFKMHDADHNNKLDGSELIKSLIHWHEEGNKNQGSQVEEKIFNNDELIQLIDPILDMDDTDKDGFISYPEFIQAQQKAPPKVQKQ